MCNAAVWGSPPTGFVRHISIDNMRPAPVSWWVSSRQMPTAKAEFRDSNSTYLWYTGSRLPDYSVMSPERIIISKEFVFALDAWFVLFIYMYRKWTSSVATTCLSHTHTQPSPVECSLPYLSLLHKVWGFHGGGYEEWRLVGCYTVWLL
jgi:hypothetical protein